MLRIGVLGAGNHSVGSHGPALRICRDELPKAVALAAVCDLDEHRAEEYAKRFGFANVYTDYHAMLAVERLDGLVAVTAIKDTCRVVSDLLKTHTPLLLEKPPGSDSAETRALLAAARETVTPHMISFNRRFCPAMVRARKWLRRHVPERAPDVFSAEMLRRERREEDFAVGTGVHLVDTVLSFLGRPRRVSASNRRAPGPGYLKFEASLTFPRGTTAHLNIEPQSDALRETYSLMAGHYSVRMDYMACAVRIVDLDTGEAVIDWWPSDDAPGEFKSGCLGETRAFLRALRGEGEFAPDLAQGLLCMQVAEAMAEGSDLEVIR